MKWIQTLAISALVLLCSSDRAFSMRVGPFNVRWGQLLLYTWVTVWIIARPKARAALQEAARSPIFRRAANCLVVFSLLYFLAGIFSPFPLQHSLKLGWLLLNFGASFALAVLASRSGSLPRALRLGVMAVALVILIDWSSLYLRGGTWTLGYAEKSYPFLGVMTLRPHGFYYEPSYASCSLALASLIALGLRWKEAPLLLLATFFVGARSGLLTLAVGVGLFALAFGLTRKSRGLLELAKALGITAGLVVCLSFTSGGNRFIRFMAGPMGFSGIEYRLKRHFLSPAGDTAQLQDPFLKEHCQGGFTESCRVWAGVGKKPGEPNIPMSEGERLSSIWFALGKWLEKPLFGHGVAVGANGRLLIDSQSMWLELLCESGLLAALFFFLAIVLPWIALVKRSGHAALAALVPFGTHVAINMNFTQSLPRLDYWLVYFLGFFALTAAYRDGKFRKVL